MEHGETAYGLTFDGRYAEKLKIVQGHVTDAMEASRAEAAPHGSDIVVSTDACLSIMEGGKRTRGVLALTGYQLFGGDPYDAIAGPAAAAVEIVQTYALVLDDVADRSVMRRDRPAAHMQMTEYLDGTVGPEDASHFGQNIAQMEAITQQHRAQRLLGQLPTTAERRLQAINILNSNMVLTGIGQQLDMFSGLRPDVTPGDARKIAELKTAYYSMLMPLQIGAALAGADEQGLALLEPYALPAGYAFQMRDDVLGVFGEQAETGKSNKSDIMEGKRTVMYLTACEAADEPERAALYRALGNAALTDREFQTCRSIIRATGAHDYVMREAEQSAQQAVDALDTLLADGRPAEQVQFLREMALYGVRRSR